MLQYAAEKAGEALHEYLYAPTGTLEERLIHVFELALGKVRPDENLADHPDLRRRLEEVLARVARAEAQGAQGRFARTIQAMSDDEARQLERDVAVLCGDIRSRWRREAAEFEQ